MGQFQCQAETVARLNGAIVSPPGSLQQICGLLTKLMIINKGGAFHPYLEPKSEKIIISVQKISSDSLSCRARVEN
jgi:hypothetical protein